MGLSTAVVTEAQGWLADLKAVVGESHFLQAVTPGEETKALSGRPYDVVFVDQAAVASLAGLCRELRGLSSRPEVVVFAASRDADEHATILADGADTVLWRDLPMDRMRGTVAVLLERAEANLSRRIKARRFDQNARLSDFVSKSPVMEAFRSLAERVAPSDTTLMLLGETGVGKGRLAAALHCESPRSKRPFIGVNCGALPEPLLESELFGHAKGAFTGAHRARRGFFELANGGTLLLDEIGDMPLGLQVKLLRVLDDGAVWPVGSEEPRRVDVRLIAATHRDLKAEVSAGRFRADLYYRLSVVTLMVPPLRERTEDIADLARGYIGHFAAEMGRRIDTVSPAAIAALESYPWPGNVRELMNALERAVLLATSPEIGLADLPPDVSSRLQAPPTIDPVSLERVGSDASTPLSDTPWRALREQVLGRLEARYLTEVMTRSEGSISGAARLSGLNERSLYDKLRRHGLRKEDFRVD